MKRITQHLYFWVLLAIVTGGVLGVVNPSAAVKLKPLGDGFIVVNTFRPGDGFNVVPATLDASAVAAYAKTAAAQTTVDFILHIIPKTFTEAFTGSGDMLQVLFVAILFGYALMHLKKRGSDTFYRFIEEAAHVFFTMMNLLMKLAPIGAGGGDGIYDRPVWHRLTEAPGDVHGHVLSNVHRNLTRAF